MKQKILPVFVIVVGLLLLGYPFFSNYIFEKSASSTIKSYEKKAEFIDYKRKKQLLEEAKRYNEDLLASQVQLTDPFQLRRSHGEKVSYNKILSIDNSMIIGYLKIPCISIELPIYHGTSAQVLEHGVGHLAASSFPIGGKSTHSVLTGHTGLSSARIFTDLTKMKKADLFFVRVLNKNLAYKVDRIVVVRPEDTKRLQIIKKKDYITLVTCTPYGVNDHRLLVRGKRIKYEEKQENITKQNRQSQWMEIYKKAMTIGMMIVLMIVILVEKLKSFGEKRQ